MSSEKLKRANLYFMNTCLLWMMLASIGLSCKKYDTGPPTDPYSTNTFYVSFSEDGNRREYRQTLDNVVNDARSHGTFDVFEEMTVFSKLNSPVYEGVTIDFAKMFSSTPNLTQMDSLFTFQRYSYFGPPTFSQATAIISYTDSNGFTWTTQNTGNAQIGSFVMINYSFAESGTGYRYTVKGTFSCLLYNTSSPTQYKTITNGAFTGKFGYVLN